MSQKGIFERGDATPFNKWVFLAALGAEAYGGWKHSGLVLTIGFAVLFGNMLLDLFARRGSFALKLIIGGFLSAITLILFYQGEHGVDVHLWTPLSHLFHLN